MRRVHHLGPRASALLDGQLDAAEAEAAWAHVAECQHCRDDLQRETWVKQRMAALSSMTTAPTALKGDLLRPTECIVRRRESRRVAGFAAVSGGAVGAAVMGFVAFSAAPAAAPTPNAGVGTSVSIVPAAAVYLRR